MIKRDALLTWSLIGVLLSFVGFLPVNHTCLDQTIRADQASCEPGIPMGKLPSNRNFRAGDSGLGAQVHSEKSDVCLACLWSRTVLRADAASEVAVARTVVPAPSCFRIRPIRITDYHQSALKRGPPPA